MEVEEGIERIKSDGEKRIGFRADRPGELQTMFTLGRTTLAPNQKYCCKQNK